MMEKFKNNTKIKLISLLSSIVLWMYVMAIVDPQETRTFEGIDVTIKNMSELKEKNLIIYPEIDLTADISLTGKLSNLKKVSKDNIHVYGEINDPIEGKNQIYLTASTPSQVTHDIKNNIMIVNLEKVITEKKQVAVKSEGSSTSNIDKIIIDDNQKSVSISGPRTSVNEVEQVVGVVNVGLNKEDFSTYIDLKPLDKDGNEVKDIQIDKSKVNVNVIFLQAKEVPIKVQFEKNDNIQTELNDYKLSENNVTIKGKKEILDGIEYIETEKIVIDDLGNIKSKDINLSIPKGVTSNIAYVTIRLDTITMIKESFEYTSEEVEIRNNQNNIDLSTINIPDNIKVDFEYQDGIEAINKSDILIYIDLLEEVDDDKKYSIKYETKYDINEVVIQPDKTL